jgi:hypothetical protein
LPNRDTSRWIRPGSDTSGGQTIGVSVREEGQIAGAEALRSTPEWREAYVRSAEVGAVVEKNRSTVETAAGTSDTGGGFFTSGDTGRAPSVQAGTGSGEAPARLFSTVLESVDDLRQTGVSGARFDIETDDGGIIRVHLNLRADNLTARIGVTDAQVREVLSGHVWELNHRLETQGLVPEDIDFYLMGENGRDGSQNTPVKHNRLRAAGEETGDNDELTLVELPDGTFESWA